MAKGPKRTDMLGTKQLPNTIEVRGERFTATVLQVMTIEVDGSPRTLKLLHDDETVDVKGGEQFFIVYASDALRRRRN